MPSPQEEPPAREELSRAMVTAAGAEQAPIPEATAPVPSDTSEDERLDEEDERVDEEDGRLVEQEPEVLSPVDSIEPSPSPRLRRNQLSR